PHQVGHQCSGNEMQENGESFGKQFVDAGEALWDNLKAWIFGGKADWSELVTFWDQVFFPYMIGGIIPGIIAATLAYYLAVPLIHAYQMRRKGALKAKLEAMKEKAAAKVDAAPKAD
ncbi:MAG: DUF2062 domain-containing protein, partial [Pseudomonadota bacterium]